MFRDLVERKWDWIDEGMLPYALAAMRSAWVWLLLHMWSIWVQPERGDLLSLPVVFGLLACSTLFAQLGTYVIRSLRRATLLVTVGGLAALAVALYMEFGAGRLAAWDLQWLQAALGDPLASAVIMGIAAWLWWWGILAGRDRLYHDTYVSNFTLGIAMLGAALAVSYASRIIPPAQALLVLLIYFAVGLGSLALAGLQESRAMEFRRSQQSLTVSRYWLWTVAGVIVVVLALGLLIGLLLAPGVISRIGAIVGVILDVLAQVLLFVLLVFAYLFFGLFELLGKAGLHPPRVLDNGSPIQLPNFADQFKNVTQEPVGISPGLALGLHIGAGVLLVAAIVAIFALAYRRFLTFRDEDVETTRDLILSMDLLKEQLGHLFGRQAGPGEEHIPPFASVTGDDPREQIRRTYQALLAWAAARGLPRQPGLTPMEYAGELQQLVDGHREEVDLITRAYLLARYGSEPVSDGLAQEVSRAWDGVNEGNGQVDQSQRSA